MTLNGTNYKGILLSSLQNFQTKDSIWILKLKISSKQTYLTTNIKIFCLIVAKYPA